MTDSFSYLIEELGKILKLPLHVDRIGACSILFPPEFLIQLQLDSSGDNLFLFTKIGTLPPGRFREDVLKEGLKANGLKDPIPGILSYIDQTSELALFHSYPLNTLNGERLVSLFASFIEFGLNWKEALHRGTTHPTDHMTASFHPKPFGLQ
jgi:hypothetical protein